MAKLKTKILLEMIDDIITEYPNISWLQLDSNPEPLSSQTTTQPVWPNGWGIVYELSGSGFESSCSHLNFRFRTCFEQRVPWHSETIECGFTLKRVLDMARTYNPNINDFIQGKLIEKCHREGISID